MNVKKISISLKAELGEEVHAAAQRAGISLSSWLADAAAAKLRAESLREFLDEWEQEQGTITPEELSRARTELGLQPKPDR